MACCVQELSAFVCRGDVVTGGWAVSRESDEQRAEHSECVRERESTLYRETEGKRMSDK